jgi:hypothetical protein
MGRDHGTESRQQKAHARRFGLSVGGIGLLALVVGLLLLGNHGVLRTVAIAALGYGIGLVVSGLFLAAGWLVVAADTSSPTGVARASRKASASRLTNQATPTPEETVHPDQLSLGGE